MIALCNFEAPIRDCFICDENPEVSNVNNYDIETKDMGLDQLQALLTNIVS